VGTGISFSKLATQVLDNGSPVLRELAYDPTLGFEGALGVHWRTNSYGGLYIEGVYHMDLMNDVVGNFKSIDYEWTDNNSFIMFRMGVLFNIGSGE